MHKKMCLNVESLGTFPSLTSLGDLVFFFFFFYPDGLFGQCQSSKQDLVQYQVSVPVLKRMQEVLKQLMLQGEEGNSKTSSASLQFQVE